MRNTTAPGKTPTSPSSQTYSPSVPISLYREVVAELQTARETLDSLKSQNQLLIKQNQQLRQEIENVVHSAVHLQTVVDSLEPVRMNGASQSATPHPEIPSDMPRRTPSSPGEAAIYGNSANSAFAIADLEGTNGAEEPLFTEESEQRYRRSTRPMRTSDTGGLWLLVAVILIVVSAFGAGYWVVRPLLMKR